MLGKLLGEIDARHPRQTHIRQHGVETALGQAFQGGLRGWDGNGRMSQFR